MTRIALLSQIFARRSHVAFRERIVVGRMRPAVGFGDAEIGEQKRRGLGSHGTATVGMQGQLAGRCGMLGRGILEQCREQGCAFFVSDAPADDPAAEDVDDDVESEIRPFGRPHQLGDVPGPYLVGGLRQQLRLFVNSRRPISITSCTTRLPGARMTSACWARTTSPPTLMSAVSSRDVGVDFGPLNDRLTLYQSDFTPNDAGNLKGFLRDYVPMALKTIGGRNIRVFDESSMYSGGEPFRRGAAEGRTVMMVCLEAAYYVSQILLFVTAVVAAYYGYHQLVSTNRYELLRMLEDERFREARRLLWKTLCAPGESPAPRWWEDERLEEAAGKTCASFDIVALMAKRSNRRPPLIWVAIAVPPLLTSS
jgi:hypothetical protein